MIKRFPLLQAFVAVARTGKMKEAAGILTLTPGAVSQRIRQLESEAGEALFVRTRGGVELTEAGKEMFAAIDEHFQAIEIVDRRVGRGTRRRTIVVSTMQSFAASWLVPRLPSFAKLCPDVDVVIDSSSRLIDLKTEPVDLAVRHGLGKYPGLESKWLMAPELIIVASPDLLTSNRPIHEPADCLQYPLIHGPRRKDWPLWFEALGISAPNATEGYAFSDRQLIIAAAVAGQGLALVHDVEAADDLRSGKLIRPLTTSWPAEIAYYAVATDAALQKPIVRQFRDWLVTESSKNPLP